jgi:hypothetical protein
MSQRQRVQVPQRSYSTPVPRHERQLSELSAVAESIQTRPSVDEENIFEEDSTSEEESFQPDPKLSGLTETPITAPQMVEHTAVDVSSRTDSRGFRPLTLLSENVEKGSSGLKLYKSSISLFDDSPNRIRCMLEMKNSAEIRKIVENIMLLNIIQQKTRSI